MKTIGFVSLENPMTDRAAWSGTLFKICEGIQKAGFNVKWIRVNPPIFFDADGKTVFEDTLWVYYTASFDVQTAR